MIGNFVEIKNKNWIARILPSFGTNVISLKDGNTDILRTPKSTEELSLSPYLYGMPLLFPGNRVENGEFVFEGKKYCLPINEPERGNHIHGLLFDAPFTVTKLLNNKVECVYENKDERYPFPFKMTITYTITDDGLFQNIVIKNTGETSMPVHLVLHTTFIAPKRFCVPIGKRWEVDERYIPTGNLLELTPGELLYRDGCNPKEKAISGFFVADKNHAIIGDYVYRVSNNYTQWILFNGGGDKGFLCVEPQTGPVNGLNMKNGYICLEKHKEVCFSSSITRRNIEDK